MQKSYTSGRIDLPNQGSGAQIYVQCCLDTMGLGVGTVFQLFDYDFVLKATLDPKKILMSLK